MTKKQDEKQELQTAKGEQLPDFLRNADAGAGMEGADVDSFAIPFLQVLQKGSPQCDESLGDPLFDPDARPGQLVNSVTQERFDGKEGVDFVPCAFQRRFLKWGARKAGGGFEGDFTPEEVNALRDQGKIVSVEGRLFEPLADGSVSEDLSSVYRDTRMHFGLLLTDAGPQQVLLSLTSTQIKKSKALMSLLRLQKANGKQLPTFANIIRVTSVPESNDQGSWYGVKFDHNGYVQDQALYEEGMAFWEAVAAGSARVQHEAAAESESPQGMF